MVELFVLNKKKRPRGRFFFLYYAFIVQYKPNYAFWFYQIVRRFARLFLIVSTYGAISGNSRYPRRSARIGNCPEIALNLGN